MASTLLPGQGKAFHPRASQVLIKVDSEVSARRGTPTHGLFTYILRFLLPPFLLQPLLPPPPLLRHDTAPSSCDSLALEPQTLNPEPQTLNPNPPLVRFSGALMRDHQTDAMRDHQTNQSMH